jgi:hypothetical protein
MSSAVRFIANAPLVRYPVSNAAIAIIAAKIDVAKLNFNDLRTFSLFIALKGFAGKWTAIDY